MSINPTHQSQAEDGAPTERFANFRRPQVPHCASRRPSTIGAANHPHGPSGPAAPSTCCRAPTGLWTSGSAKPQTGSGWRG